MITAYEDDYHFVTLLPEPAVLVVDGGEQLHNWAVINKKYGTQEGTYMSLPAAIGIAIKMTQHLDHFFDQSNVRDLHTVN